MVPASEHESDETTLYPLIQFRGPLSSDLACNIDLFSITQI